MALRNWALTLIVQQQLTTFNWEHVSFGTARPWPQLLKAIAAWSESTMMRPRSKSQVLTRLPSSGSQGSESKNQWERACKLLIASWGEISASQGLIVRPAHHKQSMVGTTTPGGRGCQHHPSSPASGHHLFPVLHLPNSICLSLSLSLSVSASLYRVKQTISLSVITGKQLVLSGQHTWWSQYTCQLCLLFEKQTSHRAGMIPTHLLRIHYRYMLFIPVEPRLAMQL